MKNRKIDKYRVWDEETKEYVSSRVFINHHGEACLIKNGCFYPHKTTKEHCTGLKDKNVKLIFKGDIVRFLWQLKDNEVCKIVWDKIHCSFACVDIKTGADFITWYSVFENGQSNRCEIIGNIHEMAATK